MFSKTALWLILLLSGDSLLQSVTTGGPGQSPVKLSPPPPSLKAPKSGEVPRPSVRKRFDPASKITYVNIDIPLARLNTATPPSSEGKALSAGGGGGDAGGPGISFVLAYKGAAASELSAAYLIINFGGETSAAGGPDAAGREVEVQADAYLYTYSSIDEKSVRVSTPTAALPPPKKSITIKLPLDELEKVAFANRIEIRAGNEELRVRSIQLGELRKILISQNAN